MRSGSLISKVMQIPSTKEREEEDIMRFSVSNKQTRYILSDIENRCNTLPNHSESHLQAFESLVELFDNPFQSTPCTDCFGNERQSPLQRTVDRSDEATGYTTPRPSST